MLSRRSRSRSTWYSRSKYANAALANSSDTAMTATKAAMRFARREGNGSLTALAGSIYSRERKSRPTPPGRRGFARLGLDQLVADAPHGLNPGIAIAQLLAQPRYVHVD